MPNRYDNLVNNLLPPIGPITKLLFYLHMHAYKDIITNTSGKEIDYDYSYSNTIIFSEFFLFQL